jgi:hypothetical protein
MRGDLRKVNEKGKTCELDMVKSKTVTVTKNTKQNDMQNKSEIESEGCTNQEKEQIGEVNTVQGQTVTENINKNEANRDENTGER